MDRLIFWAISRCFIPETSSFRSISSSVSVQGRPAGRGPVIFVFFTSCVRSSEERGVVSPVECFVMHNSIALLVIVAPLRASRIAMSDLAQRLPTLIP